MGVAIPLHPLNLMTMDRLDYYDIKPAGMERYLSLYGWHFSKKMAEWAISIMRDRNNGKLQAMDKQKLDDMLKANGIDTTQFKGYDALYVYHMGKADYLGGCISNDASLLSFVRDYLCDKDGYKGVAFTRFYADCIAKGEPILWEEML